MNDNKAKNYIAHHPFGYIRHSCRWWRVDTVKFLAAVMKCTPCLDGTKIRIYSRIPRQGR